MSTYQPFAEHQASDIRSALERPVRSLEDFAAMRSDLGRAGPNAALKMLSVNEPGFGQLFIERIAPALQRYALLAVKNRKVLSLQVSAKPASMSISRTEVAGFVAHLLLGTLQQPAGVHPHLDGSGLFDRKSRQEVAKLRCMLEYFSRISTEPPKGTLTIERLVQAPRSIDEWASDNSPLGELSVDPKEAIEDLALHRQADFANAFLGGGVLSGGCVQEEIRFSISPELLFGLIVSPRMNDDEAILLRGSERFARVSGYAFTLAFAGTFHDQSARLPDGSLDNEVIAMDAIHFTHDPGEQFGEHAVLRELNKARVAFRRDARNLPIATGNWGCGAFRGDPPIKAVIQWLAASAEGRVIRYCSFNDPRIAGLGKFVAASRTRFASVGALVGQLVQSEPRAGDDLFAKLSGR